MSTSPAPIEPETKDWTFVLEAGCAECGFDPVAVTPADIGPRLRATVPRWTAVLARPAATERPAPTVWSPVEYACHVRDTCRIFRERLALMLDEDNPGFANWDQDETAVADAYWAQDPATVSTAYDEQATATAALFDSVGPGQYDRPGRRSNGSVFTVASFGRYFLHDIEHHLDDVSG